MCLGETDLVLEAGYTKPLSLLSISDRVLLMRTLMLYYALLQSRSVLDQLAEGLFALGVLEAMKLYPNLMEPLFVAGLRKPLITGKKLLYVTS